VAHQTHLRGYTRELSYQPGELVDLFIGGPKGHVDVSLHRLRRALDAENQPPDWEPPLAWSGESTYPCDDQPSFVGSFMLGSPFEAPTGDASFSFGAWVWVPAWSQAALQSVLSLPIGNESHLVLGVEAGRATLANSGTDGVTTLLSAPTEILERSWTFIAATVRGAEASVRSVPADALYGAASEASARVSEVRLSSGESMTVAGSAGRVVTERDPIIIGEAQLLFTGKVEAPFLIAGELTNDQIMAFVDGADIATVCGTRLISAFSFAPMSDAPSARVRSLISAHSDGVLVNLPLRGVTSRLWDGSTDDFRREPEQYDAVHFHDTDIADVGWSATVSAALPNDIESGLYGIRLVSADQEDVVPIVVTAAAGSRKKIAVLISTFTYLAYANELLFQLFDELTQVTDNPGPVTDIERSRLGDASYGLSLYEKHRDGSGVALSSAARPIVNYRPYTSYWMNDAGRHLAADLYLIEWLHSQGFECDLITDLEVHQQGAALLEHYQAVLTGCHPEYCTEEILDAFQIYRDGGGHLLYLGGNGFYWVTGVLSVSPLVVEIRRGHAGVRAWTSEPGEEHLWSTGLSGGMWRERGRAPQKLVGVGFCAQGWGRAEPYRLNRELPEGYQWLLAGIDGDTIGDRGWSMNGAAGDELDRADVTLGTPPGAVIIGSSFGHTDYYQRAVEEVNAALKGSHGGTNDPEVHADLVFFETPEGGSVFSVGSIAWTAALLVDGGSNGVSQLTANVLNRALGQNSARGD